MDLGKEKIILITVLIISYLVIEISVGWIISCNMPDRYKNKMVRIDNKNSEEELSSGTSLLPSEPLPLNMKPEKSSNIDPGIHVDSGSGIDIDIDIDVL